MTMKHEVKMLVWWSVMATYNVSTLLWADLHRLTRLLCMGIIAVSFFYIYIHWTKIKKAIEAMDSLVMGVQSLVDWAKREEDQ